MYGWLPWVIAMGGCHGWLSWVVAMGGCYWRLSWVVAMGGYGVRSVMHGGTMREKWSRTMSTSLYPPPVCRGVRVLILILLLIAGGRVGVGGGGWWWWVVGGGGGRVAGVRACAFIR